MLDRRRPAKAKRGPLSRQVAAMLAGRRTCLLTLFTRRSLRLLSIGFAFLFLSGFAGSLLAAGQDSPHEGHETGLHHGTHSPCEESGEEHEEDCCHGHDCHGGLPCLACPGHSTLVVPQPFSFCLDASPAAMVARDSVALEGFSPGVFRPPAA